MATESLSYIKEGVIGKEAVVIDAVAASANIVIWSPVILSAAGSNEDLPRADTTATVANPLVFGVAVE